jgi:gliding motility-associated-like protein
MTMKKLIFTIVAISASALAFAQATLSAGPDQTICAPNSATLTATIVPQAPIAYAPDSYTTGTIVSGVNIDDIHSGVIPIGFGFCFMGNTYTDLVISTNNYVTFNTGVAGTYSPFSTIIVPNPIAPTNTIMGPWQDIHPGMGGTIRYAVYGTAPYRHLTISWYQIPMFSCTSLIYSSQIQIYETTNVIESHIENRPLCAAWNNGNAVHALHNANGTLADVVPGRNNTPWVIQNEGYRWTPQGLNPTINWYANGILVGTGLSITVTPTIDTEYICELVGTGAACAAGTVTDTVKVFVSSPIITVTSQNADCLTGVGGSMSATVTGAATPFNFVWNTVPPTNAAAVANVNPGNYTVTLTDANGCVAQDNVTITQQGTLVTSVVSTIDLICNGLPTGNLEVVANGTSGPYIYTLGTDTSYIGVFSNLYAGTYDVVIYDAIGCSATQQVTLVGPSNPISIAQTSHIDASCFGYNDGSVSFTASGGTPPYNFSSGITNSTTGVFNNLIAGSYLFSVSDANGCYVTYPDIILQTAPFSASISSMSDVVCYGQGNGSATVSVTGGVGPYFYNWNSVPPQNGSTATNLNAGFYTVSVSDNNGCISTASVQIIEPDSIALTANADLFICQTFDTTLIAHASGGFGTLNYTWTPGNINNDSVIVAPTATTIYTVTVTDANGCIVNEDVEVMVFGSPDPIISKSASNGCPIFCPTFTDLTLDPPGSVNTLREWNFGDGENATGNNILQDHCYKVPGIFDVTLTVITDKGCKKTVIWDDYIEVFPNPVADFVANPLQTDIMNPSISFTNLTSGATNYSWNFGDNDSLFTTFNPNHTYSDTGTFVVNLIVSTINNCIDSINSTVIITPSYRFFIPSSFTPNGDGLNDLFEIRGAYIQACNLEIYDRWGKPFYNRSGTYGVSWDGANAPQGVYVYKIKMKDTQNKDYEYIGELTVFR